MISSKTCKVSGDELTSASDLVTGRATGLSEEKTFTSDRIAGR
jgi:hypothetical protein